MKNKKITLNAYLLVHVLVVGHPLKVHELEIPVHGFRNINKCMHLKSDFIVTSISSHKVRLTSLS